MAKTRKSKFISPARREKMERDAAIYKEFVRLMAEPDASATEVTKYLMEKYNIHSPSTVWEIRRRVEKSLAKED